MIQQGTETADEKHPASPTASGQPEEGEGLSVTMTDWVVLVVVFAAIGYGGAYYFGYVDPFGSSAEQVADDSRDVLLKEFSLPDMKRMHSSGQEQIKSQHRTVQNLLATFEEDRGNAESGTQLSEAWGLLGQLLHLGQFPEPAAVCYANAAALRPTDFRWPYLNAKLLYKDDPQQAKQFLDRARKDLEADQNPRPQQHVALWYWIGMLARNGGDFGEARSAFRKALGYNQNAFAVWMSLGQMELEAGNAEAAIKALVTTQKLLPAKHKSIVAYSLGLAYRANKQEKLAEAYLKIGGKKAQKMSVSDPLWARTLELLRTPKALSQRAIRLLDRGSLKEAESLLREAARLSPDDSGLHNNLAGLLLMQDRVAEAEQSFTKAIELNPKLISALRGLAAIASKANDFETAEDYLESAFKIDPEDRSVLVDLGRLEYKRKDYQEALKHFEAVLALDPGNPEATLGRELVQSSMKAANK